MLSSAVGNKFKEQKAFTIVEMLTAIIILLMVTAIVAAGIPAASDAYENVVIASNAEVALSTATSALRNELGTAKDVEVEDNNVYYTNETLSSRSRLFSDDDTGIMCQRYAVDPELFDSGEIMTSDPLRLVSKKASGDKLHVTYESVEYPYIEKAEDPGEEDRENRHVVAFKNIRVAKDSSPDKAYAERDLLLVRVYTE